MSKGDWTQRLKMAVTDFAGAFEQCEVLERAFFSREYGTSAADELTQADLDNAGIELNLADVLAAVNIVGVIRGVIDAEGRRQALDSVRDIRSL